MVMLSIDVGGWGQYCFWQEWKGQDIGNTFSMVSLHFGGVSVPWMEKKTMDLKEEF